MLRKKYSPADRAVKNRALSEKRISGTITPQQFLAKVMGMPDDFQDFLRKSKEEIAEEARIHFDNSFNQEGFTDERLVKWPERNKPDRRKGGQILYKTGNLMEGNSVRILDWGVMVYNNVKYAPVHNFGLINGKGYQQRERKFIGDSQVLRERISTILYKSFKFHLDV